MGTPAPKTRPAKQPSLAARRKRDRAEAVLRDDLDLWVNELLSELSRVKAALENPRRPISKAFADWEAERFVNGLDNVIQEISKTRPKRYRDGLFLDTHRHAVKADKS